MNVKHHLNQTSWVREGHRLSCLTARERRHGLKIITLEKSRHKEGNVKSRHLLGWPCPLRTWPPAAAAPSALHPCPLPTACPGPVQVAAGHSPWLGVQLHHLETNSTECTWMIHYVFQFIFACLHPVHQWHAMSLNHNHHRRDTLIDA